MKLAKRLKKEKVNVDVINFGEEVTDSGPFDLITRTSYVQCKSTSFYIKKFAGVIAKSVHATCFSSNSVCSKPSACPCEQK